MQAVFLISFQTKAASRGYRRVPELGPPAKKSWTDSRQSSRNFFQPSATISEDSKKRLNHKLRLLLILGGLVAFLGRVRFAHVFALFSFAVPF
jgi:hypothetical protein